MAFDTYLELKDIPGEATATGMEKKIEIFSFSWGASNPTTIGPGKGGLAAGRASISSFNVMKKTDSSSCTMFANCCAGQHIVSAHVFMRKATGTSGKQGIFLQYDFDDVMVESIQWSGSSGGDDTPTESVSFAFAKVTVTYSTQDTVKGTMTKAGTASWDLTKVTS